LDQLLPTRMIVAWWWWWWCGSGPCSPEDCRVVVGGMMDGEHGGDER
jgi:hypothetical protein